MLIGLVMVVGSGLLAAAAILLVRRDAARLRLVQAPTSRSSHSKPTPTGGGIGIVLGGAFAGGFAAVGSPWPAVWILGIAVALGALGLWDDVDPRPALLRLVVQLALAVITFAAAMPLDALTAAFGGLLPAPVVLAVLTLLLVYWINLFNFMDGIDGIAGSEAVFLLLAPLGLALTGTPDIAGNLFFWWPLAVAIAAFAFLAFNWQPAKIFMGDVGSLFLGFITAAFALLEIAAGWVSPWEAAILPACFVTDGTVTLVRRALRGEAVMTAHRRHAYQHLARRFGSHQRVVLGVIAIDVVWLLPLAAWAHAAPAIAPLLTVVAYVPLIGAALYAGAGRPEHA